MDILTNTISLLFRPRQKEIARFAQDADAIQHKQLKSLLSRDMQTFVSGFLYRPMMT